MDKQAVLVKSIREHTVRLVGGATDEQILAVAAKAGILPPLAIVNLEQLSEPQLTAVNKWLLKDLFRKGIDDYGSPFMKYASR